MCGGGSPCVCVCARARVRACVRARTYMCVYIFRSRGPMSDDKFVYVKLVCFDVRFLLFLWFFVADFLI